MQMDQLFVLRRDVHCQFWIIVASSTASAEGATLYLTLSPCKECSKLVHQSGIKRLVYRNKYKDDSGLRFLEKAGVRIEQLDPQ